MTADRAQRDPTPEQIMDELSPSARRCLRSMDGTPDDAAGWYNRLAEVRAAMEKLMEKQMPGAFPIPFFSKKDGESVLARAQAIQDQFKNERAARASSLVLPPGAR